MKTKSKPNRRQKKTVRIPRGNSAAAAAGSSFPVIAMAASVGGLKALSVILGGLPVNFPAAIAIVMHVAPDHKSLLAEILKSRTHLAVKQAHTGDVLSRSGVFIAPPNHHLSVAKGGRLKLSSSAAEKVNHARPSAEPLFVSVAAIYKKNAIAVVLTGGDGDGSFGVQIIKDQGGKVIAQDRATSENFSMPETSIETGDVDFILPLDKIAPKLMELVERGVSSNEADAKSPPAPPSDGGAGRGEEVRFLGSPSPRSSPHSFLAGRGRSKAAHRPAKRETPRFSAGTKAAMIQRRK